MIVASLRSESKPLSTRVTSFATIMSTDLRFSLARPRTPGSPVSAAKPINSGRDVIQRIANFTGPGTLIYSGLRSRVELSDLVIEDGTADYVVQLGNSGLYTNTSTVIMERE